MNKELIYQAVASITDEKNIKIDEPMRCHTSFKVGGPADLLVAPASSEELSRIIKYCKKEDVPIFVMGNGTNLLVTDKGIRGVVVKIFDNFNKYTVKDNVIEAYGGALLSSVSKAALKNELTGLEFASGIPGTIGGAVAMNAGAYGGEMKDVVVETEYMDKDGEVRLIKGEEHEFAYRTSFIQKQHGIVLKSRLRLKAGNRSEIEKLMEDLTYRRRDKQPLEMPSAGSVFKRPEGYFAGKLIEDCGLRGYSIGGAQVSFKHCGFIVNNGNADSRDVLNLVKFIQERVKEKFGVELLTEIRIIGEQ
ncbi:MAG: UDP-N-acetylmuramate dehydrogenase [Clostridiaceae bacterium]|nr:UDP-N-acetylmuramate dehydrogenase [Clostridiaceae bacterium]